MSVDTNVFIDNMTAESVNEYDDIIYALKIGSIWNHVPYVKGGLYDKVFSNIKERSKEETFPEQERYQWFQILTDKYYDVVCYLAKPNVVPGLKTITSQWGSSFNVKTGVIKMKMKWYCSATERTNAVTFGDSKYIVKPLKILDHTWMASKTQKTGRTKPFYNGFYTFECKKCGMKASRFNEDLIVPLEMLTCDEFTVKDILL